MSTPLRIGLVACSKSKLSVTTVAGDLYTGRLFRLSCQWAKQNCDEWWILSGKYGVVRPDTVIEPYELALSRACREYRISWTCRVNRQLQEVQELYQPEGATFIVLAGIDYLPSLGGYDLIGLPLVRMPHERPLLNMGIGKQIAWLKRALAQGDPFAGA